MVSTGVGLQRFPSSVQFSLDFICERSLLNLRGGALAPSSDLAPSSASVLRVTFGSTSGEGAATLGSAMIRGECRTNRRGLFTSFKAT